MFTIRTPQVKRIEVNEDELKRMLEEDYDCKVVDIDFDENGYNNSLILIYMDKMYNLENAVFSLASQNGVQNVQHNTYNLKNSEEASMLKITLDGLMYNENEEGW